MPFESSEMIPQRKELPKKEPVEKSEEVELKFRIKEGEEDVFLIEEQIRRLEGSTDPHAIAQRKVLEIKKQRKERELKEEEERKREIFHA